MGDEQQGPVRWWKQKGYLVTGLDGFSSCYGRWCHPACAHPFRLKMGLEGWPLKNFLFSQRMQYPHGSPQLSITLVPRDPKPPSNFQGHQTRAWAKCSHTFKKKNPPPPTSWLPLLSPARQYTKGGVYWPFWKHPEILNPIIGHITSSSPDALSQVYKPTFQPAQTPFSTRLPRSLDAKPSPPAVNSFASF